MSEDKSMTTRILIAIAALAAGAGSAALILSAEDGKKTGAMPEIRVDDSPVDRSNAVVVTSYADALDDIRHSVVSVYSSKIIRPRLQGFPFDDPFFRRFFGPGGQQQEERVQQGVGSGVVVTADGYILTNNHVVEGSDAIKVSLPDGRELDAKIVGADPRTDVAVVKVEAEDLPFATLADSDKLRVGDVVFAVGNPLGIGQTTTMGIVSATGRSNLRLIDEGYENFIQTDASINLGNSGGALVDAQGRVVGINTAIISTSRGNIGIGFAIPVNLASTIMRSLIETGAVARGFLGVSLQDLDAGLAEAFGVEGAKGAIVKEISPDSPAEKAGLRQGDVITGLDGRSVDNSTDLRLAVSQMIPGTSVSVSVIRDGEAMEIPVELGRLDENTVFSGGGSSEFIEGINVASVSVEMRQQFNLADNSRGLVVIDAAPDSPYSGVLPAGTVIEQVNRQPVTDLPGARAALGRGRNILLLNYRGVYRYVALSLN
ncbi:MAG: Do family serine endopeptidase [Opitutaceae bacterium]